MKKIIYSDADGTMFSDGPASLTERNLNAIHDASNEGIEFIMCTATSYFENTKELCAKLKSNYLIASSGAQIIDLKKNEVLFESFLEVSEIQKINDYISNIKMLFAAWNKDELFVNSKENEWLNNFILKRVDSKIKVQLWNESKSKVYKIWAFGKDKNQLDNFEKWLSDELDLTVTRTGEIYLDITPKGISKGSGVEFMTKYLDSKLENVMSIGDTVADVAMFKVTGYSYSMDNADRNTKDSSKYHTCDVKQNGLALAIEDYAFRTKEVR